MLFKNFSLLALTTLLGTTAAQFAPNACDSCLIKNMLQVPKCGIPSLRTPALVKNPATYTPEERKCVCALASDKSWVTNCHTCDGYMILMLTTQLSFVQRQVCATELPTVSPITSASTSITASTITFTSTSTTASITASTTTSTQISGTTTAPSPPSNTKSGAISLKASVSVVVAAIAAWALL